MFFTDFSLSSKQANNFLEEDIVLNEKSFLEEAAEWVAEFAEEVKYILEFSVFPEN